MRVLLLLLAPLLVFIGTGCQNLTGLPPAKGEPMFAWAMTDTSFHGMPKQRTGYFFFLDPKDEYSVEDNVVIEKWRNGRLLESVRTEIDLAGLRAIGLKPFDYDVAVKAAVVRGERATAGGARPFHEMVVLDGCDYEATYDFEGVRLSVNESVLDAALAHYAPWNGDIAKLQKTFDFFFLLYGRAKADIYDGPEYR